MNILKMVEAHKKSIETYMKSIVTNGLFCVNSPVITDSKKGSREIIIPHKEFRLYQFRSFTKN